VKWTDVPYRSFRKGHRVDSWHLGCPRSWCRCRCRKTRSSKPEP